jgi:hypothetical protein
MLKITKKIQYKGITSLQLFQTTTKILRKTYNLRAIIQILEN